MRQYGIRSGLHIAPPCRLHGVVGQDSDGRLSIFESRVIWISKKCFLGFRVAGFEEIFPVRLQET